MVLARKSKQNRVGICHTFTINFITRYKISLIFMLHALALVTFSLNTIFGSLLHSLVTNGINHAAQNTSTRTIRLYV